MIAADPVAGERGTILVTGASGFVGGELCRELAARGRRFLPTVRRAGGAAIGGQKPGLVGELGADTDWSTVLAQVRTVVHLASRVHVLHELSKASSSDLLAVYRAANTQGTLNLARQAATAGVRRFVFVSTVKVNGEGASAAYSESAAPCPADPYAISKWDAEQGLRELAASSAMDVVIVRPPLVYGPGVRANFLSLMRWIDRGIPLPFGAIHNQRSLVALANLVDFLILCTTHPAAANETFLVSDGEDLSTTELLVRMAVALGKPSRLLPVPASMLSAGASWLGKNDLARRLCGSLTVDIAKARSLLGWLPPLSVDEGLQRAAADFLLNRR